MGGSAPEFASMPAVPACDEPRQRVRDAERFGGAAERGGEERRRTKQAAAQEAGERRQK